MEGSGGERGGGERGGGERRGEGWRGEGWRGVEGITVEWRECASSLCPTFHVVQVFWKEFVHVHHVISAISSPHALKDGNTTIRCVCVCVCAHVRQQ